MAKSKNREEKPNLLYKHASPFTHSSSYIIWFWNVHFHLLNTLHLAFQVEGLPEMQTILWGKKKVMKIKFSCTYFYTLPSAGPGFESAYH